MKNGAGIRFTYDAEADVMYITFGKPKPCLTDEIDSGVCLRYSRKKLNGITIIDYSKRTTDKKPNGK